MRRKGFTLAELMVVIGVVALIVTIVLPTMSSVHAVGRSNVCKGNLYRLSQAFTVAGSMGTFASGVSGGLKQILSIYPQPRSWPTIPKNAVADQVLYMCPDGPVKKGKGAVDDLFKLLEYQSEQGKFTMNVLNGASGFYKSQSGEDPQKGAWTDYLLQDDQRSNGQFDMMRHHGWIDTDGVARVWHSGEVLVYDRIPNTPEWAYTDTTYGPGPGRPDKVNTCGNLNAIWWRGKPAWGTAGAVQNVRGQTFKLADWNPGFTNYGINSAACQYAFGSTCIVLVDFNDLIADMDVPKTAFQILDESDRHLGRVNYLLGNGSVHSATPGAINPIAPDLRKLYWTP